MSWTRFECEIERPVAGGRMLARHEGLVVFVSGAIPGERVRADLERRGRDVAWAHTVDVLRPSPHRRGLVADPACGGMAYAHIAYDEQRRLKAQVVADAFRRLARITLDHDIPIAASPERGYRLRARLHLGATAVGFLREGTHVLCDARSTGQLRPDTVAAVEAVADDLGDRRHACAAIVVAETVHADARVLHLEPTEPRAFAGYRPTALGADLAGLTADLDGRLECLAGMAVVTDTAESLFGPASPVPASATWSRHAPSFFQSNRFLAGALAESVLRAAADGPIVDLYAGVGLFAVALASMGRPVIAVEGHPTSAADLRVNAEPWPTLHVIEGAVETAVPALAGSSFGTAIVDPPRTGLSRTALAAIAGLGARRLIYISCDPPTLARDTAKLVEAGYGLTSIEGFDLFPNTPHVETVLVLDRRTS